jgi:hypothetical protein
MITAENSSIFRLLTKEINTAYFSKQTKQFNFELEEMFEDAKMVGRSKLKMDRQYNGQRKKDKRAKTIYKTLDRTLKIEQHICEIKNK